MQEPNIIVEQMSREDVEKMLKSHEPSTALSEELKSQLIKQGWTLDDKHYCIEKIYKGYRLVIEFCIGDFCTYIGSKNEGYLLESKVPCENFIQAILQHELVNVARIDAGQHWKGEED